MTEVTLIFEPDGTLLVPRGLPSQNKVMCSLFENIASKDELHSFFNIADETELVFGEPGLCG